MYIIFTNEYVKYNMHVNRQTDENTHIKFNGSDGD